MQDDRRRKSQGAPQTDNAFIEEGIDSTQG